MTTFKQFLEQLDDMERLTTTMWLRHHLKVDQFGAEEALDWLINEDEPIIAMNVWEKMISLARQHGVKLTTSVAEQDARVRETISRLMQADDIVLESDALEDLPMELFFKHVVRLPADEIPTAMHFMKFTGPEPSFKPLKNDDAFDHLCDWVMEDGEMDSAYDLLITERASHLSKAVRLYLKRRINQMSGLDESQLEDVAFEMAFRREFGATQAQAEELVAWIAGDKDWEDLDHGAHAAIFNRWHPATTDRHPGMSYDSHVMDLIHDIFKKKFDLDMRDIVR